MKKLFLTLMMVVTILGAATYIRQDPLTDGRYQLFDRDWNRTGYVIRDRLCPDKYRIYDKDWHRRGYIEEDSGRWDLQGYDKK